MNWFYLSLKYFTQQQREYLVSILTSLETGFTNCVDADQNMILFLYSKIPFFSVAEKVIVYDYTLRTLLKQNYTCLYEINKGESITVRIEKDDNDNWSAYKIAVRDDDTNLLLSSGIDNATNNSLQEITVNNFPLSENKLHKLRVTLENETDGVANGDVVSTIGYVYALTSKNVDVDV
jgi:hypothetical protein